MDSSSSFTHSHSFSSSRLFSPLSLCRFERLAAKICRFRHHVINLQAHLSCSRDLKSFYSSDRSRIAWELSAREECISQQMQHAHAITLTRLALESAKRKTREAERALVLAVDHLVGPDNDCNKREALSAHLRSFSAQLDEHLRESRKRKWLRDDVQPGPLWWGSHPQRRPRGTRAGSHVRRKRQRGIFQRPLLKVTSSPLPIENTVVNLSSRELTDSEISLLRKGLTFCPTGPRINRLQLTADLHEFYRRLRLKAYFANQPYNSSDGDSALKGTVLARKSSWQPPKCERSPEVEIFVKVFHESVSKALRTSPYHRPPPNLLPEEQQALSALRKYNDILLRPADKGSTVVIQDTQSYDAEVLRQLSDRTFYKLLKYNPTHAHNIEVKEAVRSLLAKGVINKRTATDLVESKPRTPHFYTLPKIHKRLDNPPGRPIVSSNGAPTERISAFVDLLLQPLVTRLPSYIKDTKDLLRKLQSLPPLPQGALLFTMDVVGLYTNIPHEDGLKACETMLNQRNSLQPPTADIIRLARLVLEKNNFEYDDQHYLQIKGTAMGTRMAPSYANLFMGCLEASLLGSAPDGRVPLFFGRFIDDIFGVWLFGEAAFIKFMEHANRHHDSIAFTYNIGRSVHFLDITATVSGDRIATDLFAKPTDTHQYLLPSSNHPPHVHQHLPYGLAVRICTIVSDETARLKRLGELKNFLLQREYPVTLVEDQLAKAQTLPRDELLVRRPNPSHAKRTPLVCTWHPCLPPLTTLLKQAFPILGSSETLRDMVDLPVVAYRRPKNLRDLLICTKGKSNQSPTVTTGSSASKDQPDEAYGTFQCRAPRCKTCSMIAPTPHPNDVTWSPTSLHPRRKDQRYTCVSTSVIYCVSCSAATCNSVYVGETGCPLRTRMTQHRAAIKNAEDTPVGVHFNQQGHEPRVRVLDSAPTNVIQRRILEAKWIRHFKQHSMVTLLNRDDGADILALD